MSIHLFSDQEKIEQIERVIRQMKAAKIKVASRREIDVMISLACDLRGRAPAASVEAITKFEALLAVAQRRKLTIGYETSTLVDLAKHFIGMWPTVRAALERVNRIEMPPDGGTVVAGDPAGAQR